jgi:hypothetical protein
MMKIKIMKKKSKANQINMMKVNKMMELNRLYNKEMGKPMPKNN